MATANLNLPILEEHATLGDVIQAFNESNRINDGHNHGLSNGRKVPVSGITSDADLDLLDNAISNIEVLKLTNNNSLSALLAALFAKDGELYYRDANGTAVQITEDGRLARPNTPLSLIHI